MIRPPKFLLVLSVLLIWGCGLISQAVPPTSTAQVPPTTAPPNTAAASATVGASATAAASSTPVPSATAEASSTPNPGQGLGLPGFYMNMQNVQQYMDPTGQPVASWHDVPIMPQATAGQDFNNGVYSYKAAVTLSQVVKFYSNVRSGGAPPTIGNGFSGTGANAAHEDTFLYPDMIIYALSHDNDAGHVTVVISK